MAIKITRSASTTFNATCKTCGAGFSYEVDDLCRDYLWGGNYVPCPSCGDRHRHPDQRNVR